ncbi:MAG TPA: hypothetical protein VI454_07300 [Verrucomicrobiae bacterium]
MKIALPAIFAVAFSTVAWAGDPQPLLTTPGKMLVSEDFSGPEIPKTFRTLESAASFSIVDGALQAVSRPGQARSTHGVFMVKARDLTMSFAVKFTAPGTLYVGVDGYKESFKGNTHLLRFSLSPERMAWDQHRGGPDSKHAVGEAKKSARAAKRPLPTATSEQLADPDFFRIEPLASKPVACGVGEWHEVLIEVSGNELVAQLDGEKLLATAAEADVMKNRIGLGLTGRGTVLIDRVRISENTRRPDWAQAKAKLAAQAPAVVAPVPAFPGAEGAGMFTTGGRGGTVVHVTNLNLDGPGSLADAVGQSNRIVVFDVSGIIDLSAARTGKKEGKKAGGKTTIAEPNITIAGQTAPGEGICIKGGTLQISAENVIVRHLRVRRGWNREGDTGDGIEVKPVSIGEKTNANGQTVEALAARIIKKEGRDKFVHEFAPLSNIVVDHCSTSWATDENLTVTHADRTTVSWSIAAEGCDYHNPKQTPPNHSEGSLWGSGAPDGRSTMHHMLYAHNRLRNPRTTGGDDVPPVLTMFNSVVYNWSEYATHTGSERVRLNWLNNYYKPGLDTPADIRTHAFEFHGDPGARIFASGNFIAGSPAVTANNKLGIFHNQKFKKMSAAEKEAMKVNAPFSELPPHLQSAEAAFESVLADAGATLPARDAVDLRIVNSVRAGAGKIIGKETDLPAEQRWPDYRSLPAPGDTDGDGIPDFWEKQFDLNPNDATDSAKISAGGYANIEHYINNTDPTGGSAPIVFVAATVSRAREGQAAEWRVTRTGNTTKPLSVAYTVSGDAQAGKDFAGLAGSVTIPAGQRSATISLPALAGARDNRTVVVTLATSAPGYHVGCPSASLVVIRNASR